MGVLRKPFTTLYCNGMRESYVFHVPYVSYFCKVRFYSMHDDSTEDKSVSNSLIQLIKSLNASVRLFCRSTEQVFWTVFSEIQLKTKQCGKSVASLLKYCSNNKNLPLLTILSAICHCYHGNVVTFGRSDMFEKLRHSGNRPDF